VNDPPYRPPPGTNGSIAARPVRSAAMSREGTFLLALGMLIAAGAAVSASGWILFVRDRRAARGVTEHHEGAEER
jgi:hypothetical protein